VVAVVAGSFSAAGTVLELELELDLSPVPEAELVPEVAVSPDVNLGLRNHGRKLNRGL